MKLTRVIENLKKQALKTGCIALDERYNLETGTHLIKDGPPNHGTNIVANELYVTTAESERLVIGDNFIKTTLHDLLFFKEKTHEERTAIEETKRKAYRWGLVAISEANLCTGEYIISMYTWLDTSDVTPCCLYIVPQGSPDKSANWELADDEELRYLICE